MNDLERRFEVADIFRGILIICVLYGHSLSMINEIRGIPWNLFPINVFLSSFNMPAFCIISGYFAYRSLSSKGAIQVTKSRLIRLVPVLVIWCIIPCIISLIVKNEFSLTILPRKLINSIFEGKLWFISAYLTCTIVLSIYYYAETKCAFINHGLLVALKVFFAVLLLVVIHVIPFSLGNTTYLLPFFFVGYGLCKYKLLAKEHANTAIVILGGIYLVILFFYSSDISFYSYSQNIIGRISPQVIGVFCYRFCCAICGSCFFFAISLFIKGLSKVKNAIITFGRNSLQIYILSMYLQELLIILFKMVLQAEQLNDMNVLFSVGPIFFILLITSSYYIGIAIKKVPFLSKILVGA